MRGKIYPANQIATYLYIDAVVLVFLFYQVLSQKSLLGLPWSIALLFLLVITFYINLWNRDWKLLLSVMLGCLLLAALAVSTANQWLLTFGFIMADMLGRARKKTHILLGNAGIIGMYLLTFYLFEGNPLSFLSSVLLPLLILQLLTPWIIRMKEQSKSLKRQLLAANEKIERYIQEEERHRIARDLHDTLGQTLTMIKMKSELAIRLMDKDGERAKKEMAEVMDTSRSALKEVRELVTSMKHIPLHDELEHAVNILQMAGIRLTVQENAPLPSLPAVEETMLALTVREALTNVIKHSDAENCTLRTGCSKGLFHVEISDDGKGFPAKKTDGNGLITMKERMFLLHGGIQGKESAAGGAAILLWLPVDDKREERA